MLIFLKSKLLGPHVWKDEYMDREIGRSLRFPQAGCGRIAANGDEYSIVYDMEKYSR